MNTLHNTLIEWVQQLGISENGSSIVIKGIYIIAILISAFLLDWICRKVLIPVIRKITSRTETSWDDHLLNDNVLNNVCDLIPPIAFYAVFPFVLENTPELLDFIRKICIIYIIVVIIKLICSFISSLYSITSEHDRYKNHTLKGFYQMLKLVVVCIGAIIIISTLINKSPITILTGLGAGTAILMLVFQDTIKGLVAGVQLMANDMLRPGDWITVPKHGADGDVLEVTLTTVKVRNWDQTIITVPPYALVNDSFQNWRGMFDKGARRIKRSVNIDMNTVRFCTKEEIAEYMQQQWMEGFEPTCENEAVNLYVFRHYLEQYLRNHPKVSHDLILTVRQLQPTPQGMPLELYFFSADPAWLKYEHLQAEVFDHVLAMLNKFGLKVFQSPSGSDLQKLS